MFCLIVPYILLIILSSIIFFIARRKYFCVVLVVLVSLWINYKCEIYALNLGENKTNGTDISILSFNIHAGGDYFKNHSEDPIEIKNFLESQGADVLVLQEYDTLKCAQLTNYLSKSYPYHDIMIELAEFGPNAIFSKYPIIERKLLSFDNSRSNKDLWDLRSQDLSRWIDYRRLILCNTIDIGGRCIEVISCHLESNHIDITNSEQEDSLFIHKIRKHLFNIERSESVRMLETNLIKEYIKNKVKEYPLIVCGDFNMIAGAKPLTALYDIELKDAWWEAGFGYGATYQGHAILYFRLDHIFHSSDLDICEVNVLNNSYSDHKALAAKFKFRDNNNEK